MTPTTHTGDDETAGRRLGGADAAGDMAPADRGGTPDLAGVADAPVTEDAPPRVGAGDRVA